MIVIKTRRPEPSWRHDLLGVPNEVANECRCRETHQVAAQIRRGNIPGASPAGRDQKTASAASPDNLKGTFTHAFRFRFRFRTRFGFRLRIRVRLLRRSVKAKTQ